MSEGNIQVRTTRSPIASLIFGVLLSMLIASGISCGRENKDKKGSDPQRLNPPQITTPISFSFGSGTPATASSPITGTTDASTVMMSFQVDSLGPQPIPSQDFGSGIFSFKMNSSDCPTTPGDYTLVVFDWNDSGAAESPSVNFTITASTTSKSGAAIANKGGAPTQIKSGDTINIPIGSDKYTNVGVAIFDSCVTQDSSGPKQRHQDFPGDKLILLTKGEKKNVSHQLTTVGTHVITVFSWDQDKVKKGDKTCTFDKQCITYVVTAAK